MYDKSQSRYYFVLIHIIILIFQIDISSSINSKDQLVIQALGNPFRLGMLYDARSNGLISGFSLWDDDVIEGATMTTLKKSAETGYLYTDTTEEKNSLFGITSGIELGIYIGDYPVSGSASFLVDVKSSAKECSMAYSYYSTSYFQTMSMDLVDASNIQYKNLLFNDIATHFVSAILYGNRVIFKFKEVAESSIDKYNVMVNLQSKLTGFTSATVDADAGDATVDADAGDATVDADAGDAGDNVTEVDAGAGASYTTSTNTTTEGVSVQFFGDFRPEKVPATYDDAVIMLNELPELLTADKLTPVPMTVYLLPLTLIDDKATKFVTEVENTVISKLSKIFDHFDDIEAIINDIEGDMGCFPQFLREAKKFENYVKLHKVSFEFDLKSKVRNVRSGTEDVEVIKDILANKAGSSFSAENLSTCLEYFKLTAKVLRKAFGDLEEICTDVNGFEEKMAKNTVQKVIRLSVNTYFSDTWLSSLKPDAGTSSVSLTETTNLALIYSIKESKSLIKRFISFSNANNDLSSVSFIMQETFVTTTSSNRVQISNKIDSGYEDFTLPSSPSGLKITTQRNNKATVQFKASDGSPSFCQLYTKSDSTSDSWTIKMKVEPSSGSLETNTIDDIDESTIFAVDCWFDNGLWKSPLVEQES